jgi:hypothetical protein
MVLLLKRGNTKAGAKELKPTWREASIATTNKICRRS